MTVEQPPKELEKPLCNIRHIPVEYARAKRLWMEMLAGIPRREAEWTTGELAEYSRGDKECGR